MVEKAVKLLQFLDFFQQFNVIFDEWMEKITHSTPESSKHKHLVVPRNFYNNAFLNKRNLFTANVVLTKCLHITNLIFSCLYWVLQNCCMLFSVMGTTLHSLKHQFWKTYYYYVPQRQNTRILIPGYQKIVLTISFSQTL